MPIFVPGIRDRHNRPKSGGKRSVVAMLSLTAMVDMFTVLVIFLLQNYRTTGEVIQISKDIELPKASAVKELKPAHVVILSKTELQLDKQTVASFDQVKEQSDWMITPLRDRLLEEFRLSEERRQREGLSGAVKQAVDESKGTEPGSNPEEEDKRITVQADKKIDMLTVKKVLYTLTEAGASQINFAVMKEEEEKATE